MSLLWAGKPTVTGASWAPTITPTIRRRSWWTHGVDPGRPARSDHGVGLAGAGPRRARARAADDRPQGAGGMHDPRNRQRRLGQGPSSQDRAARRRYRVAVVSD